MLATLPLDDRFKAWNREWKAPFGFARAKRVIPRSLWKWRPFGTLVGPFAFQPNAITRTFEYPWAFYATELRPHMRVIDLGGGLSGFSFVLSRHGLDVTIVDPFLDYGRNHTYTEDPVKVVAKLNRVFGTSVKVQKCSIQDSVIEPHTIDRVFCISTLEHLADSARRSVAAHVPQLLSSGGRFVLTVDLFLNLSPFSVRERNEYGSNISVCDFVADTGLTLSQGDPRELLGYPKFDVEAIKSELERYFIGHPYPVLTQTLVLDR